MCNASEHLAKYPETANSSLSALQLQVTDPLSRAIFLACSDACRLVLLLLSGCLSPALLVALMPLDHKPETMTHICRCSRYCKRPCLISLAMYYHHERYREYNRRELSSFQAMSMKLTGLCAHQWRLSHPLVALKSRNTHMLLHDVAGGPRQGRILWQTRSVLNQNRLTVLSERKLLMFMHMNTNWLKAPVLWKTIRFQIHQSRNPLSHCMWDRKSVV